MADEEGRGRSDDLFEDLDKFFASIDESEWPDVEGPEEEPEPGEPVHVPAAEEPPAPEMAAPSPEPEPPAEEQEEQQEEPEEAAEPILPAEEPESELPDLRTDEEAVLPPEPIEEAPTREMTTEDWARLRDVLGEEEEAEESFEFTDVPTDLSPEETLFGYPGPGESDDEEPVLPSYEVAGTEGGEMPAPPEPTQEGEPGELTLDDLKKAPPEYTALPRSDEEPISTEPEEPAAAAPESFEPEEPSLADVEAAADQLAEEFRTPPGGVEDDLLTDLGAPAPEPEPEPEPELAPPPVRQTVKVGEPESLLGPSWEDPTAQTITSEPSAPSPERGRNLPAAVLTGVALVVLALVFVFISKALFAVLAGAVILFGQFELYVTMQRKKYQPATLLGLVLGGFTLAGAYFKGEPAMLFLLALAFLTSFLWYMAAAPQTRVGLVGNIGATVLGVAYAPLLGGYVFLILTIPGEGRSLMLAVLGLTFLNDIAAFVGGTLYGSRPLAPSISPRKSWEGALIATIATLPFSIAIVPSIDGMDIPKAVALALVVSIFGPLGDLAESLLKRDLGVKDMGNVLPGHGGVLDRIDSALFVAPAAFYFLRLIF
ncbi:MAG TPA: phosphatidate cytidylyltransferase [Actinomycetota bacterium]|nr:phosphatidate cytidylyltransferase [Actinomycetota bacterium]